MKTYLINHSGRDLIKDYDTLYELSVHFDVHIDDADTEADLYTAAEALHSLQSRKNTGPITEEELENGVGEDWAEHLNDYLTETES